MNADQQLSNKKETYTVFLQGHGYVLSFDINPSGRNIVRSNYKFDSERAALLTEYEANEVLKDLDNAVIRPMAVVPSAPLN